MLPEPRRAVAYIAARLIGKRNGSAIYDYTGGGGYTHFSGSVGGNISIFDHSATVEPAQWLIPFMHESGDICAVQPGRRRAVRMKGVVQCEAALLQGRPQLAAQKLCYHGRP